MSFFPVLGKYTITSPFGTRTAPKTGATTEHLGVDIGVPTGTSVLSASSGVVSRVAYSKSRGNYVMVDHGDGVETLYQHLNKATVRLGQSVNAGEKIALSGSTGISTGPHLHYEVLKDGKNVDPLKFDFEKNALGGINMSGISDSVNADRLLDFLKSYWLYVAGGLLVIAILTK